MGIRNRFLYRKDDPLRDLHVPKSERKDTDPEAEPVGDDIDADEVRANTEVVAEDDLV